MTTALTPASTAPAPPRADAPSAAPRRRLDESRLAGIGALGFAGLVITTNILQGATPALDADAAEVTAYLTDHRAQSVFAVVAYGIGALFLLTFASAFYGRLRATAAPEDQVWARLGMMGALLIMPMFGVVVVTRLVLLAGADDVIATPELITLLWRVEMAAILINSLPISAAVLGFGVAGARAGLLPGWFRRWAPVAAGTGVISASAAIASLEGAPTGVLGFVPFTTWMVLLLTAGVRQLRSA